MKNRENKRYARADRKWNICSYCNKLGYVNRLVRPKKLKRGKQVYRCLKCGRLFNK